MYGTYYSTGREEIFHTRRSLPPPTYVVWSGLSGLGKVDPQDMERIRAGVRFLREALEAWKQAAQAGFDAAIEIARRQGECTASVWNKIACLPVIKWLGQCEPCDELNEVIQKFRSFIIEGYPELASGVASLEAAVRMLEGGEGARGLGLPPWLVTAASRVGGVARTLIGRVSGWGLVITGSLLILEHFLTKRGERSLVDDVTKEKIRLARDMIEKGYPPDKVKGILREISSTADKYVGGGGGGTILENVKDIAALLLIAVFAVIAIYIVGAAVSAVRSARS